MPQALSLEYPVAEMRRMADLVVSRALAHVGSLPTQPVLGDVRAEAFCRALREPVPEGGAVLEPLLDLLFDECIPRSFNAASPGYLAFIPGGGVYPAALADFIADTVNRYTGVWQAAPALVQLEAAFLDARQDAAFQAELAGLLASYAGRPTPLTRCRNLGEGRFDFLVDRQLVVELKAVEKLAPIHKAQVLSYLKAANLQLGLLLNFNTVILGQGIKRVVLSR